MAIINNATLNALRTMVRREFQNALVNVDPKYKQIASVVPSNTKSNTYGWLGSMPSFREWIGDRVINSLKEHGYQIINKTWENTIGVNRDDVEDDNLGIYTPMVQMLAQEGAEFPDELVFALLEGGFASLCYDGQNFFDTDYPVNDKQDGRTIRVFQLNLGDPAYQDMTLRQAAYQHLLAQLGPEQALEPANLEP